MEPLVARRPNPRALLFIRRDFRVLLQFLLELALRFVVIFHGFPTRRRRGSLNGISSRFDGLNQPYAEERPRACPALSHPTRIPNRSTGRPRQDDLRVLENARTCCDRSGVALLPRRMCDRCLQLDREGPNDFDVLNPGLARRGSFLHQALVISRESIG